MALRDIIKFVTSGSWGTGLARPLTAGEADTNIDALTSAVEDLISNPVEGVSVSNIAVVGRQVTFYMTDGSSYGPFDLPVAQPVYRGDWTAYAAYSAFDIVRVATSGTYMVAFDHTAAATFDPAAASSAGDYYIQIAPAPTEKFTTVADATYDPTASDVNSFVNCTNVTGCAVTLPATVEDNYQVTFRQGSDGPITFSTLTVAPIEGVQGYDAMSGGRGSVVTCKYSSGVWYIWGRLVEVSA